MTWLSAADVSAAAPDEEAERSEAAEVAVQLMADRKAVPEEAVRDLRRLLAHDLARRNPARLRLGHLRLLIEMVCALDGADPWVSQEDYLAERARRKELGETHVSDAALRKAYGRWVSAVGAAARFVEHGGQGRVPASYTHAKFRQAYVMQEVMSALIRCQRDLGDWPTEWEYHEWAGIKRKLALDDPRLPSAKPIRKCFGDFHEALAATRAAYRGN